MRRSCVLALLAAPELHAGTLRRRDTSRILLTHRHYAEGTAVGADEGADLWAHVCSTGIASSGPVSARFPVSTSAGDRAVRRVPSDRRPPRLPRQPRLLARGAAGGVELPSARAPVHQRHRRDLHDRRRGSRGHAQPVGHDHRLLVSNDMAQGFIFNIRSLRGGHFRNPPISPTSSLVLLRPSPDRRSSSSTARSTAAGSSSCPTSRLPRSMDRRRRCTSRARGRSSSCQCPLQRGAGNRSFPCGGMPGFGSGRASPGLRYRRRGWAG